MIFIKTSHWLELSNRCILLYGTEYNTDRVHGPHLAEIDEQELIDIS